MKKFKDITGHYYSNIYQFYRYALCILQRRRKVLKMKDVKPLKINYGCGSTRQNGYVNVDLRWTNAVDLIGDLVWCRKRFNNRCEEVYLSHVIEHYSFPGKYNRVSKNSVIGALNDINSMLKTGGKVRIAVPDFEAIAKLYFQDEVPLYPRLLGRLYGEQDYRQNLHRCGFDRTYLTNLLEKTGFGEITTWEPEKLNLNKDASFDMVNDVKTSLNLIATKL